MPVYNPKITKFTSQTHTPDSHNIVFGVQDEQFFKISQGPCELASAEGGPHLG